MQQPMGILPQLLVNSLITGSIYALASAGLALTYGLLRILNFSHGQLMMVGVYLFYLWNVQFDYSVLAAAMLTSGCMVAIALLSFRVFVLPFLRFNFILAFVTTLALANILEQTISIAFGVNVKSLSTSTGSYEIWSIYITPIQILIIASAVLILSVTAWLVHSTPAGRKLRALAENDLASQSLGINTRRAYYSVFTASCLLATYAGVMVGFETNIQPTMGGSYTIKAFAAMVLGGLGNVWGTVIGSYLLGLVENLSIGLDFWGYSIPAGYKDAFAFVLILAVLLFKPAGLFGKRGRAI